MIPERPPALTFAQRLLFKLAARGISRCLTGRPEDLRKLLRVEKLSIRNRTLSVFLQRVARDLEEGTGLANLLLHVGRHANPRARRRLVENLFFHWIAQGGRIRTRLRTLDYWLPFFIVVSPTMRCNLRCTGCYSALYSKDGELSERDLDGLFAQCRAAGIHLVVVSGGEPYLLKDTLLRLFAKYRDIFFLTFTNGTLLDEPLVRELARLGNVAPAISVEGYREHTDRRRSAGVYEQIGRAMATLRRHGVIFGISVTYTRENVELVTDERFVEYYGGQGAVFAWYFMFMPVGRDPILDLVPTPEQRVQCGRTINALRKRYPVFMADFWNDGPAVGGCLAGGRRYLHVLNSGRVEPCVYAHFGVDNIRETSLLDAANSDFFRAIRRAFPFNQHGNLRRPCMIVDNPDVLRRLVAEYVVPQGHEGAEDIVSNPDVVEWIDSYARRMEELTEADWLATIEDPSARWFTGGEEYRLLFRFSQTSPPPGGRQDAALTGGGRPPAS
jgi:MoaA/NifB/PqqE/SkfB family radical SAM enzyme